MLSSLGSLALLCISILLASLIRLGGADTLDIDVRMYRDSNCFERHEELLLLDNGCYGNVYSNLTKAYSLRIVGFTGLKKLDLYDYVDACNTLFSPKRQIVAGRCERFVGGFFGIATIKLRASTCEGSECSRLSVAIQSFYSAKLCAGLPSQMYTYPVQSECMRWFNGTKTYIVDPTGTNITQTDYLMNDQCKGTLTKSYAMKNGECYALYDDRAPRSFRWVIQRYDAIASSGRRLSLRSTTTPGLLLISAVLVLTKSLSSGL
eukprot:TRINITY_DN82514_c0_g1_i1.p1 TRINITY_DN82514_c0_g1~~TRINITY_DN82514_c0_g1_i1.p1  ORF type:complete len:263 (-),score=16.00 TRINITY_DN82514_c0_g1_i1:55-843(-)